MSDQTPDQPSDDDLLQEVLRVINELARKSASADYIYRGEPECYAQASSGLYRKYSDTAAEDFDISIVQAEMLQNAKRFIGQTDEDDDDILDQLQHYGYTTNQIDFTTDYHIALFFACDGQPEKDGRVIFLRRAAYPSREPREPGNRIIAQKSIFVQPQGGVVEPSHVVVIPHRLKDRILKHLDHAHGVSARTLYNDLHGFIRYHRTHESAYAAFYEGLIHYGRRDYDAAIERYSKSLDLNPRHPASYNNRGIAYAAKGNHDGAIQDYDRAIELDPHFVLAYNNRSVAYRNKGDYDRAIKDCDEALALNPNSDDVLVNRAAAYGSKGDYDRAIKDCNKAIELNPRSAGAHNNRGLAYKSKGEYDCAIQEYDTAIELNPDFADPYTNRGGAYWSKGDFDSAIQDYGKAIELNPDFALAYANRGVAYASKGDFESAIHDYDIAIGLDPGFARAFANRGIAYSNKGNNRLAIQDYDKAIELNLRSAEVYNGRGVAYARKGDHDSAIHDHDRAIELDPGNAITYYNRGESRLFLGDWENAESDLSIAQRLGFDIVSEFSKEFGSIPAFEQKYNVELPASIAELLKCPKQE